MVEQFAYNPKSGRYISTSSRLFQKLVKEGVIKVEPVVEPTAEPVVAPEPQKPPTSLKKKLVKAGAEAIAENRNQLAGTRDLDDDETDQLLRRMLYAKLCMEPAKKKKPKPKKRKKKVVLPSSSDEESESDEESSESESD